MNTTHATHATHEYVGFWKRTFAALLDTAFLLCILLPPLVAIYGWSYFDSETKGFVAGPADFVLSWIVPVFIGVGFWVWKQATPGKMAIRSVIVDALTGEKPTTKQYFIRYIGYFVSIIPFGLGLLWVAFDSRKQGWHDKIAGTVVVFENKH